jgi:hypothetical protein
MYRIVSVGRAGLSIVDVTAFWLTVVTLILIAGLINGRRFKRVIRNKYLMVHIGTWNVMTMLKPGKMHEIADQVLKTPLQINALQELS